MRVPTFKELEASFVECYDEIAPIIKELMQSGKSKEDIHKAVFYHVSDQFPPTADAACVSLIAQLFVTLWLERNKTEQSFSA